MTRIAFVLLGLMLPCGAWAQAGPDCGFAEEPCFCGGLFAVLEVGDGDTAFQADLRQRSAEMRARVQAFHGETAGNRLFDGWMEAWRDLPGGLDGRTVLAEGLARCQGYVSDRAGRPKVSVTP
ncbi:hypothetical protein [Roseovarius atlanticus]|uniref:hypothetical protein n=1 Tax=Roseovarius atlanticus TaxID=1641875 RepID=UPI001C984724|nr:hypothetical protein [Roseovarius atlanticus]MBY5989027.1 hypothetical protein [Roseovarius atlanticus]MBY6124419.1 hypothetical protein [Roseovarius atlanticus]MBY6148914.1 hypothetical protein [Roseovarius atlanticus]